AGARIVSLRGLGGDATGLGEVAGGEREPWGEADSELLNALEHRLGGAVGEVEAVLDRDDVDDSARLFELLDRDVGDADVADLALVLELLQGPDRLLVGNLPVGRMQLVEVDLVDAQ